MQWGIARTLVGRGILLRLLQQAQLLLDGLDRRLALLHDVRVLGRLQLALELLPIQCGALGTGGTPLQQQVRLYSQTRGGERPCAPRGPRAAYLALVPHLLALLVDL